MFIVNLPLEIFDLFIEFGENKIEKRKIYYSLIISIKEFGLKSLDKKISEKYYEKLSLKKFQFVESIKNEINYGTTPHSVVRIFVSSVENFSKNGKHDLAADLAINLYEYLTLTKEGLNILNNMVGFGDTVVAKFIENCNSEMFFYKIFLLQKTYFLVQKEYNDTICKLLQIDNYFLDKIAKNKTFEVPTNASKLSIIFEAKILPIILEY
jgi:hypothetical protein